MYFYTVNLEYWITIKFKKHLIEKEWCIKVIILDELFFKVQNILFYSVFNFFFNYNDSWEISIYFQ